MSMNVLTTGGAEVCTRTDTELIVINFQVAQEERAPSAFSITLIHIPQHDEVHLCIQANQLDQRQCFLSSGRRIQHVLQYTTLFIDIVKGSMLVNCPLMNGFA